MMTNEEAIKRGAEAGMALRQALKEICGERSEIAIRAAVIALTIALTGAPAKAHCFSRWFYKTPQHCGAGAPHVQRAVARVSAREDEPLPSPPVEPVRPDIPLPDLDSPTPVETTPEERDQLLHALGIEMLKGQIGQSLLSSDAR